MKRYTTCPQCQQKNPAGVLTCPACGRDLLGVRADEAPPGAAESLADFAGANKGAIAAVACGLALIAFGILFPAPTAFVVELLLFFTDNGKAPKRSNAPTNESDAIFSVLLGFVFLAGGAIALASAWRGRGKPA